MNMCTEGVATAWLKFLRMVHMIPTVAVADQVQKSVESVLVCEEDVKRRDKELETKIAVCGHEAREAGRAGDRAKALRIVRRRRMLVQQRDKFSRILASLETQMMAIETNQMDAVLFDALKQSTVNMKQFRAVSSVDDVENTRMDFEDQVKNVQEISELISAPLADDSTDKDLESELDQLMGDPPDPPASPLRDAPLNPMRTPAPLRAERVFGGGDVEFVDAELEEEDESRPLIALPGE